MIDMFHLCNGIPSCTATRKYEEGEIDLHCLLHIKAPSNVVERLYSRAKLIMTSERRNMNLHCLESLLSFLQANYILWDAYTFHETLQEDPECQWRASSRYNS